jgi:hypothetical protein
VMATTSVIWSVDHEGRMSGVQPSWSACTGQDERRCQGLARSTPSPRVTGKRCCRRGSAVGRRGPSGRLRASCGMPILGGYRRFEVRGANRQQRRKQKGHDDEQHGDHRKRSSSAESSGPRT